MHSRGRRSVLFVTLLSGRIGRFRIRGVGRAGMRSMGLVCSSGSRVVGRVVVRFAGIRSTMVEGMLATRGVLGDWLELIAV